MSNSRYWPQGWNQGEPSLGDLLSDPVCRLLMQRDGVTVQAMSALVDRVRSVQGETLPR